MQSPDKMSPIHFECMMPFQVLAIMSHFACRAAVFGLAFLM